LAWFNNSCRTERSSLVCTIASLHLRKAYCWGLSLAYGFIMQSDCQQRYAGPKLVVSLDRSNIRKTASPQRLYAGPSPLRAGRMGAKCLETRFRGVPAWPRLCKLGDKQPVGDLDQEPRNIQSQRRHCKRWLQLPREIGELILPATPATQGAMIESRGEFDSRIEQV